MLGYIFTVSIQTTRTTQNTVNFYNVFRKTDLNIWTVYIKLRFTMKLIKKCKN